MVHRCSSEVQTAFSSFTSSLDSLLDAVPVLEAQCQTFAASTKATQQNRSKAALVLEHHDRLQDLLEVPQLLETCIRSGYYHEALELGAHARQMEEKYGNVAIVKDVGREVEKGLMGMLVQLLALLREPYKLPALVKAVGFLRRMDVLSEEELRVAFLTGREHNYRTQLVEIEREKGDPVRYVRRYIDVFREHVYDIIAQFTTIFIDNPSISSSSTTPTATPPPILNTFAQQSISALLTLLRSHVPLIEDASSLSSLLTQLNYCASSFSRVGLDFRFLVSEPFEQAVLAANLKSLKEGESTLEGSLREALRTGKAPPSWLVSTDSRSTILELDLSPSSSFTTHLQPTSPQTPPTFLAHFPPLAQLCNSHTTALNSLRLFAPLTTFPQLVHQLVKSLLRSATFILSYAQTSASEFQTAAGSIPSSAGGGGGGAGTGVGGRPGHRRNPSVSAGPSIQEQTESKLILRAFGRTFVDGLVPFLLRGLVEGVFDGEMGDVGSSLARLGVELDKGSIGSLREWVEKMERELRPAEEDSTTTSSTFLPPPPPTTKGKKNPAASPLMEEPDEIDSRGAQEGIEEEGTDLDGQIAALDGSLNGVENGGEGADVSADGQPKEDGTGSSPTPVPS